MAKHKVNTAQRIGEMTVVTTSVEVREEYITLVMVGGAIWDMAVTGSIEEAHDVHAEFIAAAEMFNPVVDKVKTGEIDNAQELREECDRMLLAVKSVGSKGYVH